MLWWEIFKEGSPKCAREILYAALAFGLWALVMALICFLLDY